MQPIFIMMMGTKGAGKTWVAERLGCARVCPDDMVPGTVPAMTYALRPAREAIAQRLLRGEDIVLDTTNAERKLRSRTIEIAKERRALVVGYWVATPLERCIDRHVAKQAAIGRPTFLGAVTTSHAQMRANPPTFDEGFDLIVQFGGDRPVGRCVHFFGHAVTPTTVRMLVSLNVTPLFVYQHPVNQRIEGSDLADFIAEHRRDYVYVVRGDVSEESIALAIKRGCTFCELPSSATAHTSA